MPLSDQSHQLTGLPSMLNGTSDPDTNEKDSTKIILLLQNQPGQTPSEPQQCEHPFSETFLNEIALFTLEGNKHSSEKVLKINQSDAKFQDKAEKAFEQLPSSVPIQPNTIVIMTEVVYKTLGDFYAAYRLINALKKQRPDCQIVWLMMEADKKIPVDRMQCDEYHVYSSWSEMAASGQLSLLCSAATVVAFPTFHFFELFAFHRINEIRKASGLEGIKPVLEYDYKLAALGGEAGIRTGLEAGALGIFLDQRKYEDSELERTIRRHSIGSKLLMDSSVEEYRHMHACFFGYRNKEQRLTSNHLNSSVFIKIVAHSQASHSKIVDIIVPLNEEEEETLLSPEGLSTLYATGITKIEIHRPDNVRILERSVETDSEVTRKTLRIFNYFPFPNEVFTALMRFSEKSLMMCTGDQSLSDVLSIKGAIPFYQIMAWKKNLFDELLKVACDICGKESELAQYLMAVKNFEVSIRVEMEPIAKSIDENGTVIPEQREPVQQRLDAIEIIAQLIREDGDTISKQMEQVQQYIYAHKNLYQNLPAFILRKMDRVSAHTRATVSAREIRAGVDKTFSPPPVVSVTCSC